MKARSAHRSPPTALYVGESDSIDRRLQQHRCTYGAANVESLLCEVQSKTRALELEALVIRELQNQKIGHVKNVSNAR